MTKFGSVMKTAMKAQSKGKNPAEAVAKQLMNNGKRRKGLKGAIYKTFSK